MHDVIYGIVDSIIDRETFILNVTDKSEYNKNNYNNREHIKIRSIDASDLGSLRGLRDKVNLERALQGKIVRCCVNSKDTSGKVVSDVKII